MPKFEVHIPIKVWSRIVVEAKNPREAFRKVYFNKTSSEEDETRNEGDWEPEELLPEQNSWAVYPEDEWAEGEFNSDAAVWFRRTPKEKKS